MKSLVLYIDKWYIVGAECADDMPPRLINPQKSEDRIWLFFYENVAHNEIMYGKGYQKGYRNKTNHYYGDVFSQITSSSARYLMFKLPQPMKGIFKDSKIFDDLKKSMNEEGTLSTYVSFSKDIAPASRYLFLEEMKHAGFEIVESAARIDHLALEYAAKNAKIKEDGYYIVLNALNENLHYSLYQKSETLFVRENEDDLLGKGADVRSRALIEHVVDNINETELCLKTPQEREYEYLRMNQFVDDWLEKLSKARNLVPIQLTGVTLSNDSYKDYSVAICKARIDERTQKIVNDIISVITQFVKDSKVENEQIKGVVFLGNTFTNGQFKKEFMNAFNLPHERTYSYLESDLAQIVSAYTFMDCSQFDAARISIENDGIASLKAKKIAEEEAKAQQEAAEQATALAVQEGLKKDAERKFKEAMEKGILAEREHNFENMEYYFKTALDYQPDNEEVKQKYREAQEQKMKQVVLKNNYMSRIQEAKKALEKREWEMARQKAEEALGYDPKSKNASRIKKEAERHIKHEKELERHIDRIDLFIANKAYDDAEKEIANAKLLDVDLAEVNSREERIKNEKAQIANLINDLFIRLEESLKKQQFTIAVTLCNQLIETDYTNARKWTARLSEINILQEKAKENKKRLKKILTDIDSALFNEDWAILVSLCNDALEIEEDESIRKKLAKAEEKVRLLNEAKEIDSQIIEIKDLILGNAFNEAKEKLAELTTKKLEKSHQIKIKELRSLIFKKEEEAETHKQAIDLFDFKEPQKVGMNLPEAARDKDKVRNQNTSEKTIITNKDFDF